jgi:hypothetical protein
VGPSARQAKSSDSQRLWIAHLTHFTEYPARRNPESHDFHNLPCPTLPGIISEQLLSECLWWLLKITLSRLIKHGRKLIPWNRPEGFRMAITRHWGLPDSLE